MYNLRTTIIKTLLGEEIKQNNEEKVDHWEKGFEHGEKFCDDFSFRENLKDAKKELLSQNPHKKGTPEHQQWHDGAHTAHEKAMDNM